MSDDAHPATHPDQNAGQDADITARLALDPSDIDAKLDAGLDESMDASDVPAVLHPADTGEPMESSGYNEGVEAAIRAADTGQ